jgi:hypothetical protein
MTRFALLGLPDWILIDLGAFTLVSASTGLVALVILFFGRWKP